MTEELAKRLDANLKSLSVKSALNPALWLVAVTFGFGLIGLKYFAGDVMVRILLVAAIGLPILVACIAFLYFVFKQPERLQSEEYQIKAETLRMVKTKGGRISQVEASIVRAINHNPRQLLQPGEDGESQ